MNSDHRGHRYINERQADKRLCIRGCGSELAPPFCCSKERSCSLDIATSSSELIPKSPTGVGFGGNFAGPGTKIQKWAEMT